MKTYQWVKLRYERGVDLENLHREGLAIPSDQVQMMVEQAYRRGVAQALYFASQEPQLATERGARIAQQMRYSPKRWFLYLHVLEEKVVGKKRTPPPGDLTCKTGAP